MASLSLYSQFETNLLSNRKVIELLLQLKSAKDHGKNYIKVRPPQPMCIPICQRQEGVRNSGKKVAPIHCICSEFLERNLCEALCKICYAVMLMSKISCLLHFLQIF